MALKALTLETRDRIAYLQLDTPPRNEMDQAFFGELSVFTKELLPQLDVQGMIISGSGRHFSSGANLEEMHRSVESGGVGPFRAHLLENIESNMAIERAPFPVVAAIGGCCLGAGLELALACHGRIAAARAVFSLPETTFGLLPGCGGTVRLAKLVGQGKALELILSGRTFLADEALALGIVDQVVVRKVRMEAARQAVLMRQPR
jgi:enoyl-CoA hydratase/carnithine racemase